MNHKENLSNNPKSSTSVVWLMINSDPARAIEFDPFNINFRKGYFRFIQDFETKRKEFGRRAKAIDVNEDTLTNEFCEWMFPRLDALFGEGTSAKAFGEVRTLNMLFQFFEGIKPYIQARKK
jgi:hypothetical protein